jgi:hypothetical protein
MKGATFTTATLVLTFLVTGPAWAQGGSGGEVTVELTRPSEPCHLECGLVYGGIVVEVHSGTGVIVQTKPHVDEDDERERERKRASGREPHLTRIPVSSANLEVVEKDNRVKISTNSWSKGVDVWVKVPKRTSLALSCVNDGDIRAEGVSGNVEVQNVNGEIHLGGISGSAVAYTTNGDVTVELLEIEKGKPMSFASLNGDVDVTLPSDVKITVKIGTQRGDVYTDFDIQASERSPKIIEENSRADDGTYRVRMEDAFFGLINGGGPEFQFSTYNGDIIIRKGS